MSHRQITSERLTNWAAKLDEAKAVPMLLISTVIEHGGPLPREALLIENSQGRSDKDVLDFLRSVCRDLEARMA